MREDVIAVSTNPLQRIPGVAVMLVALVAVFGVIAPGFLSVPNISNVLVQSTILMLLALPMTLIIMTEGLDRTAAMALQVWDSQTSFHILNAVFCERRCLLLLVHCLERGP